MKKCCLWYMLFSVEMQNCQHQLLNNHMDVFLSWFCWVYGGVIKFWRSGAMSEDSSQGSVAGAQITASPPSLWRMNKRPPTTETHRWWFIAGKSSPKLWPKNSGQRISIIYPDDWVEKYIIWPEDWLEVPLIQDMSQRPQETKRIHLAKKNKTLPQTVMDLDLDV